MGSMVFKKRSPLILFLVPAFIFMIIYLYYPFVINILYSFKLINNLADSPFTSAWINQKRITDASGTKYAVDQDIPGGSLIFLEGSKIKINADASGAGVDMLKGFAANPENQNVTENDDGTYTIKFFAAMPVALEDEATINSSNRIIAKSQAILDNPDSDQAAKDKAQKAIDRESKFIADVQDPNSDRNKNNVGVKNTIGVKVAKASEIRIEGSGDDTRFFYNPPNGILNWVDSNTLGSWNGVEEIELVGFKSNQEGMFVNYGKLFSDKNMLTAYKNTFIMMICTLVFQVGVAIILAILVDVIPKGAEIYRTVYFFPIVISATALGVLFALIFTNADAYYPKDGILNTILVNMGLSKKGVIWSDDEHHYIKLIVPVVWQYIGFYFVILATGLNNISFDIYEAARIDGVNPIQKTQYITLPLLRNTICTCITLGITGSLKVYDLPFVLLKNGGQSGKDWLLATYMDAQTNYSISFSATIGLAMVVLGVVISQIANRVFTQKDY